MLKKLKDFLNFASEHGLNLPTAYDTIRQEPSTTLLFFYVGMTLSVGSLISYHFFPAELVGPASMTLLFFGMTFVFYRMRSIDKFKINLEERSLELEDEPEQTKNGENL